MWLASGQAGARAYVGGARHAGARVDTGSSLREEDLMVLESLDGAKVFPDKRNLQECVSSAKGEWILSWNDDYTPSLVVDLASTLPMFLMH